MNLYSGYIYKATDVILQNVYARALNIESVIEVLEKDYDIDYDDDDEMEHFSLFLMP